MRNGKLYELQARLKEMGNINAMTRTEASRRHDLMTAAQTARTTNTRPEEEFEDVLEFSEQKTQDAEKVMSKQLEDPHVEGGQVEPIVKIKKDPVLPSEEVQKLHNASHAQFQAWCHHCVAGRGKGDPHLKAAADDEVEKLAAQGTAQIQVDFMYLKNEKGETEAGVAC